jgi:hypothetical protein
MTWYMGMLRIRGPDRCFPRKDSRCSCMRKKLLWEKATAFGVPETPLVNKMAFGSSPSVGSM